MHNRNLFLNKPVATAKSHFIKGSVQKVNLVLKAIRGKNVMKALLLLKSIRKHAAIDIQKVLLSALSNAEQKGHIDLDALVIKNISAGKAINLKRFQPRARGRIFGINKHYSKIYVELHDITVN